MEKWTIITKHWKFKEERGIKTEKPLTSGI